MHEVAIVILWLRTHFIVPMTVVFAALAIITYWPTRRATLQQYGSIPLRDDP